MRWFVTGTDTDVGKTVVVACLAQAARARGSVIAAKPVASGVVPGTAGEDAARIATAAAHAPTGLATYVPPVSPHRAILDGGAPIDPVALRGWIEARNADVVLVEGVGGWRVPVQLDPRIEVSDLARWTGGDVIVVAADRLGVLNHTRLTVDAIRADGLRVAGVVLNQATPASGPTSNLADLRLLLDVPVVPLGRLDPDHPGDRDRAGRALWRALVGASWPA